MAKTIILIGGGDIKNYSPELENIDKLIIQKTKKEHPKFLYIGFGNQYAESTYDIIKKVYKKYGCETAHLKKKGIINNRKEALERLKNADIIYLGGGDTIKFKEELEEYQLVEELIKAYEKNKILVGVSAGAIILSKEGYSDSKILRNESKKHEFINGLGFTDLIISPHYEEDSMKTKELLETIKNTKKEVIGIPNNNALLIEENKLKPLTNQMIKISYKEKLEEKTL